MSIVACTMQGTGSITDIPASALLLPGATVLHDRWDCNQLRLWLCVQARGHPSNVCIPALMIDHLYSDMSIYSVPGNGANVGNFSFILAQNEAIISLSTEMSRKFIVTVAD